MRTEILIVLVFVVACSGNETRREFYPGGALKSEQELLNKQMHGKARSFYENGRISYEGEYKNGKPVGWHFNYLPNGKISFKTLWSQIDGKEFILKRVKLDTNENLISETTFAQKKIEVGYDKKREYRLGDTLRLTIKIVDPKYPYCEAVLGHFDQYLNMIREPRLPPKFVEGNANHEVVMRILLSKTGRDTLRGLIRDFDYSAITDSTGKVVGEDSFFSCPIDVK